MVGVDVGPLVGSLVVSDVGLMVGSLVGSEVGSGVGSPEDHQIWQVQGSHLLEEALIFASWIWRKLAIFEDICHSSECIGSMHIVNVKFSKS